jgi:hypothetical protein
MRIISHRGYWKIPAEKNTEMAFRRSLDLGYGTETDVRDLHGKLVISHDMPRGQEMSLDDCLSLPGISTLPLALNVKADGLAEEIARCLRRHAISQWFVFDMSIPDMRSYLRAGCPVYCRISEVEQTPPWLQDCAGIWLDSFGPEWYGAGELDSLLKMGKPICVVSSELHGRQQQAQWHLIKRFAQLPQLMLCTDFPEDAQTFFQIHSSEEMA